jgi:hypothetical protein
MEIVVFTVVDASNGDAVVPDVLVHVYNAAGTTLVTFGRSDVDGLVTVNVPAGSYLVRLYNPGYSAVAQAIVVTATAPTEQELELTVNGVQVTAPASPSLCRLYADFITQDGDPLENFTVGVENLFNPATVAALAVGERFRTYTSDVNGHLEFDVVRGTKIRVALVGTPLTRTLVVPEQPVASLLSIFGVAADAFQIVGA